MSNELPPLTRLIMAAEAIDAQAAISSRSGQMADLEAEATVLREVYRDLTSELAALRARVAELESAPRKLIPNCATPPVLNGYPEAAWELAEIVSDTTDGDRDDYLHNDVAKALWDAGWREVAPVVTTPSVPSGEET